MIFVLNFLFWPLAAQFALNGFTFNFTIFYSQHFYSTNSLSLHIFFGSWLQDLFLQSVDKFAQTERNNATPQKKFSGWNFSGTARRRQILRDGFDSRLEPIAFDIRNGWLLTRRAQAHFAVSLHYC